MNRPVTAPSSAVFGAISVAFVVVLLLGWGGVL